MRWRHTVERPSCRKTLSRFSGGSITHTPRGSGLVQGGIVVMIRTPARFTNRALLEVLIFTVAIGVVVPAGAGAFATIEGPPSFSSAPGLPDGRIYEQVSPANKNGNEAGANTESAGVGVL